MQFTRSERETKLVVSTSVGSIDLPLLPEQNNRNVLVVNCNTIAPLVQVLEALGSAFRELTLPSAEAPPGHRGVERAWNVAVEFPEVILRAAAFGNVIFFINVNNFALQYWVAEAVERVAVGLWLEVTYTMEKPVQSILDKVKRKGGGLL